MNKMNDEEPHTKIMKSNYLNYHFEQAKRIGEDLSYKPNAKLSDFYMEQFYLDNSTCNIHFNVEEQNGSSESIPAHIEILTKTSHVFHTMFYGPLAEKENVKITDASIAGFKEFLQFFYMANVTLTMENIQIVIYLVKKYGIGRCMKKCIKFLKNNITLNNICLVYPIAIFFDLDDLKQFCERIICADAKQVIKSDNFL